MDCNRNNDGSDRSYYVNTEDIAFPDHSGIIVDIRGIRTDVSLIDIVAYPGERVQIFKADPDVNSYWSNQWVNNNGQYAIAPLTVVNENKQIVYVPNVEVTPEPQGIIYHGGFR